MIISLAADFAKHLRRGRGSVNLVTDLDHGRDDREAPRRAFGPIQPRYNPVMLEVMIEQWKNLDGSVDYPWSVWRDGVRIHMGGVLGSADDAEIDAKAYCVARLGSEPDSIVHL
jgi:hypothetical protein